MTKRKINFRRFTEVLLNVKESFAPADLKTTEESPKIRDLELSPLERELYANFRYWTSLAICDYIKNTPLQYNIHNHPEKPPRSDDQVIADVKYDKGMSLVAFVGGCLNANIEHHNMFEGTAKKYNNELGVIESMSIVIMQEVFEEVLEEFEFDYNVIVNSDSSDWGVEDS